MSNKYYHYYLTLLMINYYSLFKNKIIKKIEIKSNSMWLIRTDIFELVNKHLILAHIQFILLFNHHLRLHRLFVFNGSALIPL